MPDISDTLGIYCNSKLLAYIPLGGLHTLHVLQIWEGLLLLILFPRLVLESGFGALVSDHGPVSAQVSLLCGPFLSLGTGGRYPWDVH